MADSQLGQQQRRLAAIFHKPVAYCRAALCGHSSGDDGLWRLLLIALGCENENERVPGSGVD